MPSAWASAALAVALTFFLPPGPTPWIYLIAAVAGFGFAAQWVFPWAMVPDVVDYDRLRSGEQRSGMYFGVWGLATKVSEMLALAATGWLLALVHYVPNVAQTSGALLGIRILFGPMPAILIAVCLPLLADLSADAGGAPEHPGPVGGTLMAPLRVAIVGCGRIADLHVLGYRDRADAEIAAVCDPRRELAAAGARSWGVKKVYADYEALLADPGVDLVELLSPHHLHAEMTIAACAAGKHVSVQKPMAMTTAEADRMIGAARGAGVILRVYENFVFYPPHVRIREMIDAGEIGEPQMIRLHVSTGRSATAWKVPLRAWLWRFQQREVGRWAACVRPRLPPLLACVLPHGRRQAGRCVAR